MCIFANNKSVHVTIDSKVTQNFDGTQQINDKKRSGILVEKRTELTSNHELKCAYH